MSDNLPPLPDMNRLSPFVEGLGKAILSEMMEDLAAIEADRVSRDVPAGWRDLLISLTEHAAESGDHTEESFRRGVVHLANRAHKFLAASPQPQPVRAQPSEEDDYCRCEPSDWVAPSDYDGDGSVDGLARRAAMQIAQPKPANQQKD